MQAEDQKAILCHRPSRRLRGWCQDDREREEVRRISESLASSAAAIDLRAIYQDVLLKRFTLDQAAAALADDGLRHYAYEMAVCVCRGRRPDDSG